MNSINTLPKYKFDWLGLVVLAAGGIVPSIIVTLIGVGYGMMTDTEILESDSFLVFSNLLLWLGAIAAFDFVICRKQTKKKLNFNFSPKDATTWLIIFPMIFGMGLIAEVLTNFIPTTGPVFGKLYKQFEYLMSRLTLDVPTMIFTAVIMAPIFEEIVFRGIIQKGMINNGVSANKAIWITSILFGLVHGNLWQFGGAVLLGYVLGIVYEKTQSLLLPILLHLFNNLMATLMIKYIGTDSYANYFEVSPLVILSIGICIVVLTSYLLEKKYPSQSIKTTLS